MLLDEYQVPVSPCRDSLGIPGQHAHVCAICCFEVTKYKQCPKLLCICPLSLSRSWKLFTIRVFLVYLTNTYVVFTIYQTLFYGDTEILIHSILTKPYGAGTSLTHQGTERWSDVPVAAATSGRWHADVGSVSRGLLCDL